MMPVTWDRIAGARAIIEAALPGFVVETSMGSHFFHNLISLRIGYLTVGPGARDGFLDWPWLEQAPGGRDEGPYVRHVRLPRPLEIRLDGRSGRGVILKAAPNGSTT